MRKTLAIALFGVAALASAAPAMARPHHNRSAERHGHYYRVPGYQGYGSGSTTDRNGDGYDDRDLNFDGYIDAREHRIAGTASYSTTDRNGDGFDDRDRNFNGWIDPWEIGGRVRR